MSNYGFYFGTFDPIHNGHISIAQFAQKQFKLKEIYFITSNVPPHKSSLVLDSKIRFKLVQIALQNFPEFIPADIEIKRTGVSYTIDTLNELIPKFSTNSKFYLILGFDNILNFDTWKNYNEILNLTNLLIAPRNDITINENNFKEIIKENNVSNAIINKCYLINMPICDISSSHIRKLFEQNKSIENLLPRDVLLEIKKNNYYKDKI